MKQDKIRDYLTGPIMSMRTPFDKDGQVDYKAIPNMIDVAIEGGSRSVMLTAGDSHYDCLSDKEIEEITRIACETTGNRGMVIAADRYYSTDRAIEFAKYVKKLGADMLMCLPPNWAHSCTPESLSDHYAAVSKIIPVMIVTNIFIPLGADFGLKTIQLAIEKSDNIVAIKDDMCNTFAHELCIRFCDRVAIIAGGQKRNHMNMFPYKCDGYLSTFVTFCPEISQKYWNAIEAKDLPQATKIISDYDIPLFRLLSTLTGGFDAGMHGILELFKLAERYRRKPYHTITDEDMEKLSSFFKQKKLL